MNQIVNRTIKGMVIGVANIIPGISGGTMAFVLGIYDQLTESIGCFLSKPEKRKEYFLFLLNIGSGAILGFLLFAKIISFLLGINLPETSPLPFSYVPTFGLFLGLILGSIPILIKIQQDNSFSIPRLGLSIAGCLLLFFISSLRDPGVNIIHEGHLIKDFGVIKLISISVHRAFWLFIIGVLAAFTMVIPGISGSALLVSLGEYGPILNYIAERSIIPIGIILLGAGLGIILATLMMTRLLEHKAGATFYFILGLTSASCIQIIIQMLRAHSSVTSWIVSGFTIFIGILIATISAKIQQKKIN